MGEKCDPEFAEWASSAEEHWGCLRLGNAEGRSQQIQLSQSGWCAPSVGVGWR